MTRSRWTGLAGILVGLGLFSINIISGSTPDTGDRNAVQKYADFWNKSSHQSRAVVCAMVLTYVFLLLIGFAAGLRDRLRTVDSGPLPSLVLAAGTAAAALILVGAEASFAVGVTGDQGKAFAVDGKTAVVLDNLGYQLMAPGLMAAALMAVVTGILTLRTRVLPVWTAWLGFLFGLGAIGSYFSAWTGFIALPIWTVVMGVVLLLRPEPEAGGDVRAGQPLPVTAAA